MWITHKHIFPILTMLNQGRTAFDKPKEAKWLQQQHPTLPDQHRKLEDFSGMWLIQQSWLQACQIYGSLISLLRHAAATG